jgi:hypothetical protein
MSKNITECMELCDKLIPKLVEINEIIQPEFQDYSDKDLEKLLQESPVP